MQGFLATPPVKMISPSEETRLINHYQFDGTRADVYSSKAPFRLFSFFLAKLLDKRFDACRIFNGIEWPSDD